MKNKSTENVSKELLIYIVLLFVIGWISYTYRVLFGPLVISGLIAYLLYPSVTWLSERTRIDRQRLVPVVYIVFLGLFIWLVIFLTPIIANQTNLLLKQLDHIPEQLDSFQSELGDVLGFEIPLEDLYGEVETGLAQQLKLDRIFRLIQSASTNIVWVIIILIASFHLLRDWAKLREWLFGFAPGHLEADFRRIHLEIKMVWQTYLRGQLFIMFILGLFSGIGAALIGLPGSLILGLLAGTLALIPSLGPAIATGIAALVALTQGSSYLDLSNFAVALIVVGIFQGIQFFEGFWLTPRVMGRRLKLHPGLLLIAIVGTLFTLGILMALIIVPVLASLDIVFSYTRRKRAGLEPWPVFTPPNSD